MTKSLANMANLLQSLCVEHYKFTRNKPTRLGTIQIINEKISEKVLTEVFWKTWEENGRNEGVMAHTQITKVQCGKRTVFTENPQAFPFVYCRAPGCCKGLLCLSVYLSLGLCNPCMLSVPVVIWFPSHASVIVLIQCDTPPFSSTPSSPITPAARLTAEMLGIP